FVVGVSLRGAIHEIWDKRLRFEKITSYITLVYHHMGKLERDLNMNLAYAGGQETYFDYVNLEKLNMMIIKDLFVGLGYNEYDYMYWLDEEMGLNGGGLNMITGDLAVVIMDRAVEVHVLDDDSNRVQPQPPPKEDTPKKMKRVKTSVKRTPTPKKRALSRNSRKIGQASQNFVHKLSDLTTKTQPIIQEHINPTAEELDISQSQPPKETQSQPQGQSQSQPQPESNPQTQSQPQSQHQPQPQPQPHPQSQAQAQTQSETQPKPQPEAQSSQPQTKTTVKKNRRPIY
ncbi:hypothetical protein PIB30_102126, partial [Stylosanthes scabra]|nr:hypothetical protein [Stylosanthes scabra]